MHKSRILRSKLLCAVGTLALLVGCNTSEQVNAGAKSAAQSTEKPVIGPWGYPLDALDANTRPQDDLYRFANGGWLDATAIPSDRSSVGFSQGMVDRNEVRIKSVIMELLQSGQVQGSNAQKIADLYRSYMDAESINAAADKPLKAVMARISAASTHRDIAALMADPLAGTPNIFGFYVSADRKNPDVYALYAGHSGLALPDRRYYLDTGSRMETLRAAYVDHIEVVLGRFGDDVRSRAEAVLAFETAIAEAHWSRAERRNADKTYNPRTVAQLTSLAPGYPWQLALDTLGYGDVNQVVISELSSFAPIADIFAKTDVAVLRDYLTFRTFAAHANLLSDEIAEENFEFFGKALRGQKQRRTRDERAVRMVNSTLSQAVGKIYIERFFPEKSKALVEEMISNIKSVMAGRIEGLAWMGGDTKEKALEKLKMMGARVAYPTKWRDYSSLDIVADNYFQNAMALRAYNHQRSVDRLGNAVNKEEWFRGPQTVNAFYSPTQNEIFIPAGYIQSPLFDPNADPALNYGALGSIIGHEIGHGFDDQGSKYDGNGRQQSWWTDEDREAFDAEGNKFADQFSQYEPIRGVRVNGRQTLGENIGDLAGMLVAFHAYQKSLDGAKAPVLDGFTGEQRFFLGRAQGRRYKRTEQSMRQRLLSAPHSPMYLRVNGMARNMDEFYAAFDVKEGDEMYIAPDDRVKIW